MGLWDALTGKVWRYNQMKLDATRRVCRALKPYVSSRVSKYPHAEGGFIEVRNGLFAFYFGAGTQIDWSLERSLREYRMRLLSLTTDSYLHFIGAFHATQAIWQFSDESSRSLLYLHSEGICDMYNWPDSYMEQWWALTPYIANNDPAASNEVAKQLYQHIAPILGLRLIDPLRSYFWAAFALDCTKAMKRAYELPNWPSVVEAELAAA